MVGTYLNLKAEEPVHLPCLARPVQLFQAEAATPLDFPLA